MPNEGPSQQQTSTKDRAARKAELEAEQATAERKHAKQTAAVDAQVAGVEETIRKAQEALAKIQNGEPTPPANADTAEDAPPAEPAAPDTAEPGSADSSSGANWENTPLRGPADADKAVTPPPESAPGRETVEDKRALAEKIRGKIAELEGMLHDERAIQARAEILDPERAIVKWGKKWCFTAACDKERAENIERLRAIAESKENTDSDAHPMYKLIEGMSPSVFAQVFLADGQQEVSRNDITDMWRSGGREYNEDRPGPDGALVIDKTGCCMYISDGTEAGEGHYITTDPEGFVVATNSEKDVITFNEKIVETFEDAIDSSETESGADREQNLESEPGLRHRIAYLEFRLGQLEAGIPKEPTEAEALAKITEQVGALEAKLAKLVAEDAKAKQRSAEVRKGLEIAVKREEYPFVYYILDSIAPNNQRIILYEGDGTHNLSDSLDFNTLDHIQSNLIYNPSKTSSSGESEVRFPGGFFQRQRSLQMDQTMVILTSRNGFLLVWTNRKELSSQVTPGEHVDVADARATYTIIGPDGNPVDGEDGLSYADGRRHFKSKVDEFFRQQKDDFEAQQAEKSGDAVSGTKE